MASFLQDLAAGVQDKGQQESQSRGMQCAAFLVKSEMEMTGKSVGQAAWGPGHSLPKSELFTLKDGSPTPDKHTIVLLW
eukprot:1158391-Pelagomonas_calceolata.AAC.1